MTKFDITIQRENWTVHLLTDKQFDKIFPGLDYEAATGYNATTRSFYFRRSELGLRTIVHEVTHAYIRYYPINGDIEEFMCEFMAQKGIEVMKTSRMLKHQLSITHRKRKEIYG